LKAQLKISSSCPLITYKLPSKTCSYSPSSPALQIMAVLSALAVIILVPWGLNTALEISASCPIIKKLYHVKH